MLEFLAWGSVVREFAGERDVCALDMGVLNGDGVGVGLGLEFYFAVVLYVCNSEFCWGFWDSGWKEWF